MKIIMKKLLEIINTVLANRGKSTVTSINEASGLRDDLGLDSLDLAELTVRIEAEYDVDIFEDGVVTTIGEILSKIQ
jgi:acyl carrier protein